MKKIYVAALYGILSVVLVSVPSQAGTRDKTSKAISITKNVGKKAGKFVAKRLIGGAVVDYVGQKMNVIPSPDESYGYGKYLPGAIRPFKAE